MAPAPKDKFLIVNSEIGSGDIMFKKGQVSTEYLVILAVVLVVALVVVALVSGMSPLSSGVSESQSRNYWAGVSPFAISGWKYSGTTLELTLQNQEGQMVTLTGITGTNGFTYAENATFSVGEVKTVTVTGMTDCGAVGASYDISNVQIVYNKGAISGLLQKGDKDIVGKCG
jgi:hypothetical protein